MSQSLLKHIFGTSRMCFSEYCTLSILRCASKRFSNPPFDKKEKNKCKELGHTTVMMQDRLDIQEVPTIVRKLKNPLDARPAEESAGDTEDARDYPLQEEQDVVNVFKTCRTLKSVYSFLEPLSNQEITTNIAIEVLKRIVELENNSYYRNKLKSQEESRTTLKRTTVFNRLVNIIIAEKGSTPFLEGLRILTRDVHGSNSSYEEKYINSVLIRANERKFTICEMCEIVKFLSSLKTEKCQEYIDKLWVGFIDRGKEIDENNIGEVYKVLPAMEESRKMVFNLLERKVHESWWRIPTSNIVDILSVLREVKMSPPRLLTVLVRNVTTNIHSVSEDELLQIIVCLRESDYFEENVERALEKYVKTKATKIKNEELIVALSEYCVRFSLRNTNILQGFAEFLVRNSDSISPPHFKTIFTTFGILNYCPTQAFQFWEVVEDILEEKFVQFRPDDVVDICLGCVYLEKFPINMTKKVFNTNFLDRLHLSKSGHELLQLRTKLKIFDTAMTLECAHYHGPLLPREYSVRSLEQDGRVKQSINSIYDIICDTVGSCERVSTNVLMSLLPTADLYVVDILLHPIGVGASMHNFDKRKDRNLYIAVLIHTPEHFCSHGIHLKGDQVMKKRHLQRFGVNVVDMKFTELFKLKGSPKELQEYVADKLEKMEKLKA